jgi:Kef-type K+ transport system membrane component KefB
LRRPRYAGWLAAGVVLIGGVAIAHAAGAAPGSAASTKENSIFAIKVIGGLVALVVLAYLGGHPAVVRFQERLGIGGVITAGFPFVALGALANTKTVGVLTPAVVDQLRPVLSFGLGWLGFIIGAQLDIRVLDRVPKGTAYLILVEALGPFGITAAGCGLVMVAFHQVGVTVGDAAFWRDVVLLGAAAAMTAPRKFRGFANRTWHEGRGVDVLLGQLDELVGVIGLLFITAYFRDDVSTSWNLPNTAWVFVSLGLGVAIGVLIFAMVRVPVSNAEFLAVVLGSIAFASGLAGYLRLSPIAICFIAGVLVTNFPNDQRESIFRILKHLERPVHLLFLMVAGAMWDVTDWRGWLLVPLVVAGRVLGKWAGVLAS